MKTVRIEPVVDGGYMALVNGFQIGGNVDMSGAGNANFATHAEALAFARDFLQNRGTK